MASKTDKLACRKYLESVKEYKVIDEDNYFDFICEYFDIIVFVDCFGFGEEVNVSRNNFEHNSILWLKEHEDHMDNVFLRYDTVEVDLIDSKHAFIKHHSNCLGEPDVD